MTERLGEKTLRRRAPDTVSDAPAASEDPAADAARYLRQVESRLSETSKDQKKFKTLIARARLLRSEIESGKARGIDITSSLDAVRSLNTDVRRDYFGLAVEEQKPAPAPEKAPALRKRRTLKDSLKAAQFDAKKTAQELADLAEAAQGDDAEIRQDARNKMREIFAQMASDPDEKVRTLSPIIDAAVLEYNTSTKVKEAKAKLDAALARLRAEPVETKLEPEAQAAKLIPLMRESASVKNRRDDLAFSTPEDVPEPEAPEPERATHTTEPIWEKLPTKDYGTVYYRLDKQTKQWVFQIPIPQAAEYLRHSKRPDPDYVRYTLGRSTREQAVRYVDERLLSEESKILNRDAVVAGQLLQERNRLGLRDEDERRGPLAALRRQRTRLGNWFNGALAALALTGIVAKTTVPEAPEAIRAGTSGSRIAGIDTETVAQPKIDDAEPRARQEAQEPIIMPELKAIPENHTAPILRSSIFTTPATVEGGTYSMLKGIFAEAGITVNSVADALDTFNLTPDEIDGIYEASFHSYDVLLAAENPAARRLLKIRDARRISNRHAPLEWKPLFANTAMRQEAHRLFEDAIMRRFYDRQNTARGIIERVDAMTVPLLQAAQE